MGNRIIRTMKLTGMLLCICILLATAVSGAAANEAVIEIRTADDLRDVVNHPGAKFRLMNDINLQGEEWNPIPFTGELDGNNYGIYNLKITHTGEDTRICMAGNKKEYEVRFAGLFSTVDESTIRNLKIIGAHVTIEAETHSFAAILTGFARWSTFENITVEGRVRLDNDAVMSGVGGMAGFGSGYIDGCSAKVELIFVDRNLTSRCEQFMGGIMACGYTKLEHCTVEIDGYNSCFGYCHCGGLMGLYYKCGTKFQLGSNNRIVSHNTVTGRIRFFEHNQDRRAYCRGDIGETMSDLAQRKGNNIKGFSKKETRDASKTLLPENCENPVYTEKIILPADGEWGWTEHTCSTCGYHWRDTYTAPQQ